MSGLSKPLNLVFLNLKSPHGEFTIDGCKQEEGEEVGPNSLGSGSSLGRCMGPHSSQPGRLVDFGIF